ncbi:MAG: prepilin-type N-terminal cleavage/methylation domain-containing protein [Acidimicrobiia bacterium]|nr:prepilin-type N-terminal cleavage/methylation domain-containing protein [Acidimicrobiia bacterium]
MRCRDSQGGFTLVELMVVVLVIAILIAVAIPTFLGARTRAQDRTAQANLVTATKAQSSLAADRDSFTDIVADLQAEEPSLDWSGIDDEDVHVVVGDVVPGDNRQVLLYTRSNSATWYGVRIVRLGVQAGRYTCEGPAATDVDDMADCAGRTW